MDAIDKKGHRAQHQVALAEAEFQVLKHELVLQHLIDTGESTDQASALLERLRSVVQELSERGPFPERISTTEEEAGYEAQQCPQVHQVR